MEVLHDYIHALENYLWRISRKRTGESIDQRREKDFGGHYDRMVESEPQRSKWGLRGMTQRSVCRSSLMVFEASF